MKKLLHLLFAILGIASANAQQISVFKVLPYGFPYTSANFYAFDKDDNLVFDVSPNDFEIVEDGRKAEIVSVYCSEGGMCPGGNYSGILVMDISGSTRGQKLPQEKLAAEIYIDMLPAGGPECAIVAFNHKNFLVNDFSTDKSQLKKSFESLTANGGTKFDAALIDPLNGALLVAERAKYARRIILVTDGMSEGNEQEIIKKANELKAKIFVVIINGQANEFIDAITSMTDGFYFHVSNAQEATSVFKKLAGISGCSGGAGCEIIWKSEPTCNEYRNVSVNLKSLPAQASLRYWAYSKSRIVTNVSPGSFVFERIPLGSGDTTVTFTLKNEYYPVTITNITRTNPAFSIVGSTNTPFTLGTGEERSFRVKYNPQVDSAEFGNIIIEKELCGNHVVSFLSYDPLASDSIIVESPNGFEKLLAGTDTTIYWEGRMDDTVSIEYSLDGGKTWELITNAASGLHYTWKLPYLQSDSCLIKVYKDDNPQKLVDGKIFGYGIVKCIDISPDGTKLVSAGGSDCLYIWDLSTAKVIDTLCGHDYEIRSVAWSPDGSRIASGSYETIKIWDAKTGSEIITLNDIYGNEFSVAWSPDCSRIASGSRETIKIWDAKTGAELMTLKGHNSNVCSVAWSSDGSRIASGSYDSTVKIWDAKTGTEIMTLMGHDDWVNSVAWSPDGSRIASGCDDETIKIWDAKTGTEIMTLIGHNDDVNSVAWSPDGSRIASGSDDARIKIWDAKTGNELMTLTGHDRYVNSLAWSPDNGRIASGSGDETIKIWDAKTGTELITLMGHNDWVNSVAWSPDGSRIASRSFSEIKIWDAKTGTELMTFTGHHGYDISVTWSPDGCRIASGSRETIKIWDAKIGTEIMTLSGHNDWVNSIAWSPDGSRIIAGAGYEGTIKIWDANTGAELMTLTGHDRYVNSVAWSPDGSRIASGSYDSTIIIWDAKTGTELMTLIGHDDDVNSVAWSPDGNKVAGGGWHTGITIWDTESGLILTHLDFPGYSGYSIAYSPDGKFIGGSDGNIQIIDAISYKYIKFISPFHYWRVYISWHPNSNWIAGGGEDGTIRIFRVKDIENLDKSDTLFSIILPKITTSDVDMLQHCANWTEPKEKIIDNYIVNNDVFDVRIDSIGISGIDAADFELVHQTLPVTLKPKEKLKVKFSFQPKTPGIKTAQINIYSNYGVIPKDITGEALDCNIQNITPAYNFINVCLGEKVDTLAAVLYNRGASDSQIDSTVELGPDDAQFEIVSGGGSFVIAAGDTHNIRIEYKPVQQGISTCQYAFYHKGISSPEIVTFQGEGVKCELQAGYGQTIELVKPCDTTDYKEQSFTTIVNYQKTDARIDSLVFSPNDNIFRISDNLSYPFVLKSHEDKKLTIRFTPVDTGKVCSKLMIYYNSPDSPKEMSICGNYLVYDWEVTPDSVLAYDVKTGEQRQVQCKISNYGNTALYWPNPPVKFNDTRFVISKIEPNPTPAGGSSDVTVQFVGEDISFKGSYIFTKQCNTQDSIAVFSLLDKLYEIVLKSDTITAKPGDIVQVPFYLSMPVKDLYDVSDGINTEVSFNATIMSDHDISGVVRAGQHFNETNYFGKKLSLFLPKNIFLGDKIYIPFEIGLGDRDSTTIAFNLDSTSILGLAKGFIYKTNNGLIRLEICREGGSRLVTASENKVSITSITPNPANEKVTVDYNILEEGYTTIKLFNSTAQEIKTLFSGIPKPGESSMQFNTDTLESGMYYVILRTPTQLISKSFVIVK